MINLQFSGQLFPYPSFGGATHHIDLIPDEHFDDVGAVGVRLQLVQPHVQLGEARPAGHVVDQDDALRSPVVARRQGAEPLLPGRVLCAEQRGGISASIVIAYYNTRGWQPLRVMCTEQRGGVILLLTSPE